MNTPRQKPQVEYSDLLSRLFFKSFYDNAWVIPAPLPNWLDWGLRAYERTFMRVDLSSVEVDRPVFIISLPRSGSSMLQDLLCANDAFAYTTNFMDICRNSSVCAAERMRRTFGFNIKGERFFKDSVWVDGGSPADPVATWLDVFGEDPFHIPDNAPNDVPVSEQVVANARRRVKEAIWCFGRPLRRFFCKTPLLLPRAEALQTIFPDAKFIHLIRDPRAVANSMVKIHRMCRDQLEMICRRTGRRRPDGEFVPYPRLPRLKQYLEQFGAEDVRTTAHLWNDAIDSIDALRGRLPNLHEVRYEDVIEDPVTQVAKLFEFCDVPLPDASNAAYRKRLDGVGRIFHQNRYTDFETIEDICSERMARFGYATRS